MRALLLYLLLRFVSYFTLGLVQLLVQSRYTRLTRLALQHQNLLLVLVLVLASLVYHSPLVVCLLSTVYMSTYCLPYSTLHFTVHRNFCVLYPIPFNIHYYIVYQSSIYSTLIYIELSLQKHTRYTVINCVHNSSSSTTRVYRDNIVISCTRTSIPLRIRQLLR